MALQQELRRQGDFLFRYRSYLPLTLLTAAIGLKVARERSGMTSVESPSAELLESAAIYVGLLGQLVRVWVVGFTPKDTSGRNTAAGQVAASLNTTGAYSLVRNPLYVGNYLMWAAVAMATGSLWFLGVFTLTFWVYYERIVFAEEAYLERRFGSEFLEWSSRTPAFVPTRLRPSRPSGSFRWRKVLRNEKNGIFALLLLLCLVDVSGDVAEGNFTAREERASIAAALASGVLYLVLRGFKRHTSLLDEPPS